ncbi:MAG: SusC/RagA family TonB-linked outer membrane protein [Gemmatimonadaceae bacterium]|nr:SusC/RagA family TonB-linked outer membrane protein [Gemmatimonadaceae bacterium]
MSPFALRRWGGTALLMAGVLLTSRAAQAQQGTVSGRVTAQESAEPLSDVRVLVVGTTVFAITNAEGRFTLRNVPPGSHEVRVLRVGYVEQKKRVAVTGGQSATLDFALDRAVIQLQEVVTTATGESRKVELGNTVATIDVAKKLEDAPIKNMGDLLVAKAPGVQVLPANMTGGGSRVRIRGTNSISLNNDPIYIIDGVRMTSNSSSTGIGVGGTSPSRVNDINPEDIENIEVVKGPSAATLYGTDAANGVIVITTRKGRAGRPVWSVYGDYGLIQDRNTYPTMYAILGKSPGSTTQRKCLLKEVALNQCVVDSTTSLNVFEEDDLSPIGDGSRGQLGGQISGGTDLFRFFVGGDFERETGPFQFPEFDRKRFAASQIDIRDEWDRPNLLTKGSYRANLNLAPHSSVDVSVQAGYTKMDQRLPQVDNNVNSFWYNGTVGPGFRGPGPGYTGIGSLGQKLQGYAGYTPGDIYQFTTTQGVDRFIGSTNANWRPTSWLQNRADFGVDFTDRLDFGLCRFSECSDFGTNRLGRANDVRANLRNITANLGSTANFTPMPWLNLKTTVGAQFVNYQITQSQAQGSTLPPGAQTPSAGSIPLVGSATQLQKTLGLFIEQGAAFNDRMFLTAAVRTDQNSAFGTNFQRVYYPKVSGSWVLSDESFFPKASWLDQFRFRAAMGSSGVQPGPNDADRTFSVTTTNIASADVGGLRSNQLGNADLKPERSTEFETGIDSRLFGGRVNWEITYYRKQTKDALIAMPIAPSSGAAVTSQLTNLGAVKNWGWENLLTAQLFDRRNLSWDMTFNLSHNSNELLTLGNDATGKPIPTIGTGNTRQAEGYPLNSVWTRRYKFSDANGDKIIVPDEVTVDTAFTYLGYQQPRLELSIVNGIDLFNRRLRITSLLDHKSGYIVLNNEQSFLCQQSTSCPATSTLNPSLFLQARTIALRDGTRVAGAVYTTNDGFYEAPNFWRLREVALAYTFADDVAQRFFKVRGASINVAARNLKIWTDWTGVDPEQNYSQGDTQATLLTAGPPMYITARFNFRF